ncbi:MAG: DUF1549 domain-containing protein, partial [Verrucomicrobiales bacterium]|nr:DUF1549 domain-containing protein [Verrucomicrobiales bacterium]
MTGYRALLPAVAAILVIADVVAPAALGADRPVDFNRDIRPILSDRCFACHGPDDKERKAKLRLDRRDDALRPAKSGSAPLVPGKPEASTLLQRMQSHDPDEIMPPPKTGKTVNAAQIELFRRWIAQGAPYREHWAFIPPERAPVPNPSPDAARPAPTHPVDAFIEARLAQDNLAPGPEADRTTLVRRATLDLTGLPPSPEEIDAFLADGSPNAYEHLVDRLLDSPRYGERMAVEWLDAARYADTHGYHLDSGRDMTPWRDWVIRAFNQNMRFDRFTVEQLAGDLLPDATTDQKIASGFNRNHMINYEGGAIPDEYHYAYLVDRVNTTATVWLGLTMACAQCHDHKYDPLSKADYYRFLAFFNNVPESGLDGNRGNAAPVLKLPSPDQRRRLDELERNLADAEKALNAPLPSVDAAQTAWEAAVAGNTATRWEPANVLRASSAGGATLEHRDDGSWRATGANPAQDTFSVTLAPPPAGTRALRLEALADPSFPANGPGRSENGNFVLTRVAVNRAAGPIPIKTASADFAQDGFPILNAIDDRSDTGWAIFGSTGKPKTAIFEFTEPLPTEETTLILEFKSIYGHQVIGRFRLAWTDSSNPHATDSVP